MGLRTYKIMILTIALVGLLAGLSGCTGGPGGVPGAGPGGVAGGIVTPWGVFSSTDAPGEDLECIGRPEGMTRGFYAKSNYEDGSIEVTVGYYKEGDSFEETKKEAESRILACGWTLYESTDSGIALPMSGIVKGYQADYHKGEDSLSMVTTTIENNQVVYTIVYITYYHYPPTTVESEPVSNTPEEPSSPPPGVTPTGDAEALDSEARPVFDDVFGGVVLTEYANAPMVYLHYWIPREATTDDAAGVKAGFEALGYQVLSESVSQDEVYLTLQKEGNMLAVTFYPEGDTVEVTMMASS